MSNVLVAGGAGYIGSHTVCALIEAGHSVAIADDLSTGHMGAVHPAARLYRGDIRDEDFLCKVFDGENFDAVIHFAANSLVGESMADPLKYYDNNLGGTISLLKAMVRHGVKRIVFSSSAAVYGEPEQTPIQEAAPTRPTNPYGETKLAMERLLRWAAEAYNISYAALRYFNAAGASLTRPIGEDHSPETHLIPLILQTALGLRPHLLLYGEDYPTRDGTCIRDYIHIEDLSRAHILAMDYLLAGGESGAFNLGNGQGFTVREVIAAAQSALGRPIPIKSAPRRPGDPARLIASSQRAQSILGWKPEYPDIESMVASAWRWHSGHPKGYDDKGAH